MPETTPAVKPGYKTTEFWLAFGAMVLGMAAASGAFTPESTVGKIVGLGISVLASLGYSWSRGLAKSG